MKTHKDLDVWKLGIELVVSIYQLTESFPSTEKYGLSSQLRRAAVSITSNISEGAARSSKREYVRFNYIALGSLAEIETQLIVAFKLGYKFDFELINEKVEEIRRKLLNLIKYQKRTIGRK